MKFFDLPVEIRLMIYSELLARPDSLTLDHKRRCDDPEHAHNESCCVPHFFLSSADPEHPRLYPQILRACKQAHSEASPIPYSRISCLKTFHQRGGYTGEEARSTPTVLPWFFEQIGSKQASMIRRLRIDFPVDAWMMDDFDDLLGTYETLEAVRESCTGLAALTLEMENYAHEEMAYPGVAADMFALLDEHFREMPALREVVVVTDWDPDVDTESYVERIRAMREHMVGWTVKVNRVWRCVDGGMCYRDARAFREHVCEHSVECRERRRCAPPAASDS